MNYLCIDVGTTGCKCQVFSGRGEILGYFFEEYEFRRTGSEIYVDADAIREKVRAMIARAAAGRKISSVCISSLGESFVLLDKEDNILFYPMLYTDPRGEEEAAEIAARTGAERAFAVTGVFPHSMYSFSKLLWIKKHRPELFARADKVMLIGDYLGYLLTGKRAIDYALAARTGAFDVEKLVFSEELLAPFGISSSLFSAPMRAGSIVGGIGGEFAKGLGLDGAVLVLGSHDQVCAALGAGALKAGDAADGMGTVECITVLFDRRTENAEMGRQGYPCVPYAEEGMFCMYILNYSCGSTVNWFRKKLLHGYRGEEADFFSYIEKGMPEGPTGILLLPYFGGAGTPYQDLNAKGAVVNLTTETSDAMVYKAIMEGTAMEMRLNAETAGRYGITVKNVVATGGGANSDAWLQIKADIQDIPVRALRSSEGGLCGCAMLSAVALGGADNLEEAREIFVRYRKEFLPDPAAGKVYRAQYGKYKKLYHCIKEMF